MKLEPIWKPFTSLKEVPYNGVFLANFDSSLGIQTTFKHGSSLYGYEEQTLPIEYCKLPEDNEFFATLISETFSATGYVLGHVWGDWESTRAFHIGNTYETLEQLLIAVWELVPKSYCTIDFKECYGAICLVATTTTVSIQGHLFTNVVESVEFVGELTKKQKNTLWEASGLKMPIESFEATFKDSLCENFNMIEASYEVYPSWDAFVETEYLENYSEYVV